MKIDSDWWKKIVEG